MRKEVMITKNNRNKKIDIFIEIFDSMFIMILCFATLLSAMLLQDNNAKISYIINPKTLIVTFICLTAYLLFLFSQSQRGLKLMIKHVYKNKKSEEVSEK
nr:hypothetical protein [Sedimentibacter sp.]